MYLNSESKSVNSKITWEGHIDDLHVQICLSVDESGKKRYQVRTKHDTIDLPDNFTSVKKVKHYIKHSHKDIKRDK